jgi:hypothetical protein
MKTHYYHFPSHNGIEIKKDGSVVINALAMDGFPETMNVDDVAELLAKEDDEDLSEILGSLKTKLLKYGFKFTFTLKRVTQSGATPS